MHPPQTVDKVLFHFVNNLLKVFGYGISVCLAWLENACHMEGSQSERLPQHFNFRK